MTAIRREDVLVDLAAGRIAEQERCKLVAGSAVGALRIGLRPGRRERVKAAGVTSSAAVVVVAAEFTAHLQKMASAVPTHIRLDAPRVVRFVADAARTKLRIGPHVEARELIVV